MNFYVWKENEQVGPYSEEKLKEYVESRVLKPDCLIWAEGFADWIPYSNSSSAIKSVKIKRVMEKEAPLQPTGIRAPELTKAPEPNTSKYHIPICFKCMKYVQPALVNQTKTKAGFGAAIPTEIGFIMRQNATTTNTIVKLCPFCGERVFSKEEIDAVAAERLRKKRNAVDPSFLGLAIVFGVCSIVSIFSGAVVVVEEDLHTTWNYFICGLGLLGGGILSIWLLRAGNIRAYRKITAEENDRSRNLQKLIQAVE